MALEQSYFLVTEINTESLPQTNAPISRTDEFEALLATATEERRVGLFGDTFQFRASRTFDLSYRLYLLVHEDPTRIEGIVKHPEYPDHKRVHKRNHALICYKFVARPQSLHEFKYCSAQAPVLEHGRVRGIKPDEFAAFARSFDHQAREVTKKVREAVKKSSADPIKEVPADQTVTAEDDPPSPALADANEDSKFPSAGENTQDKGKSALSTGLLAEAGGATSRTACLRVVLSHSGQPLQRVIPLCAAELQAFMDVFQDTTSDARRFRRRLRSLLKVEDGEPSKATKKQKIHNAGRQGK